MNSRHASKAIWLSWFAMPIIIGGFVLAEPFDPVPHEFHEQSALSASQMNANFAALTADLNALRTELDAAKSENTALNERVSELEAAPGSGVCPSDMVPVGDFCVDRYEASLWVRKDGQKVVCSELQEAIDEALSAGWSTSEVYLGFKASDCGESGKKLCNYKQYGSPIGCSTHDGCDDYPQTFPDSGNWTTPIYSCAISGVEPSRSMTWFQAQQACGLSDRRLITNAEWQLAVAGTVDPSDTDGADGRCRTHADNVRRTGVGTELCVSSWGVEDAIGNLWEWVDLWFQAGPTSAGFTQGAGQRPWPSDYVPTDASDGTRDKTYNVNGAAEDRDGQAFGAPAAIARGGAFDSVDNAGAFTLSANPSPAYLLRTVGARCAKSR